MATGHPDDTPGCFRTPDKRGPCVAPGPVLSQRAEEVKDFFSECFSSVVGMGVGMAPNRAVAATLAEACGIRPTAEWWFLFGDLERAWVSIMNERQAKPEE